MASYDLDAARAARAEAEHEEHTITFGGEEFTLPREMPLEALDAFRTQGVSGWVRSLLGDQADAFMAHGPTTADVSELDRYISPLYGFGDAGEAQASNGSSNGNGSRSRPTSSGTTGSTSRKRSSARNR